MSFYRSISDYYRDIFPLQPMQVQFVTAHVPNPPASNLLDIGCGTGDLSMELSTSFKKVIGIDLDKAMLNAASEFSHSIDNVDFHLLNMNQISEHFGSHAFDAILCFGNTLVHLPTLHEITDFLIQAKSVMKQEGKLLLQIINYDRILDCEITSLPSLETETIRFVRNYHYDSVNHLINFETILTIKSTNQEIRNIIPLLPLRKTELEQAIIKAGFTTIEFYGNFKGDPLHAESIPLIVVASG